MKYDPTITVCSRCLRACCWQGEFMCDYSDIASTVRRKVSTLIRGDYGEHFNYWNEDLKQSRKPLLNKQHLIQLGMKITNSKA